MPTTPKSNNSRPTHAGGVVYRLRDTTPELLLVTARRDPSAWVLPKGHIEPGESPEQTAVREIYEEAGVTARVVEFLATSHQVVRAVPQRIDYYLMEMLVAEAANEGRQLVWLSEDAAIRRISFAEPRAVVKEACARLARRARSLR